ncbi:MAG: YkgJ family cysteine cluster protein [Lautropia sp.]
MSNVCIGCGACCTRYRVAFHWSETTAFPGGVVPVELTEPIRLHEVAMRGTSAREPHCIALVGTRGTDRRCGIHGSHPGVCREVAPGSDQCHRARIADGLAPVDAQQVLLAYADPLPPALPLDAPPPPSPPQAAAAAIR